MPTHTYVHTHTHLHQGIILGLDAVHQRPNDGVEFRWEAPQGGQSPRDAAVDPGPHPLLLLLQLAQRGQGAAAETVQLLEGACD